MRLATISRWRAALLRHDERMAAWTRSQGRLAAALHEFGSFGLKQSSACLFGGLMVTLLFATWRWYPADAPLARYDFLTLAAVAIQLILLATRLESTEEAIVIAMFHVVGTAMELFKTSVGSWGYPEAALLRLGGVPLFSGFMYASVGSYIARAWRLFDFRFTQHPPFAATAVLAAGIYANFFAHHFMPDLRALLFAALVALFARTQVHFRVRRLRRRMPLLLGFALVALFIWLAENAGTLSHAWLYPAQRRGWTPVPFGKLGSWLLLMIVSYVMVSALHRLALRQPEPQWAGPLETATIGHLPGTVSGDQRCLPRTCASTATTPNWPGPSPPNASARRITSN